MRPLEPLEAVGMDGFAKVFASLWTGTLYGRSDAQHVFIYLLCHADSAGAVDISPPAIAGATGLALERVQAAIAELEGSDPLSRTSDAEGRRIVRMDGRPWGWIVVNYGAYRAKRDPEARRAQTRAAVQRWREKAAVSHGKPPKAQAEAEAEAENQNTRSPDGSLTVNGAARRPAKTEPDPPLFDGFYAGFPRRCGRRAAAKAFASALKRHPDLEPQDLVNASGQFSRRMQRDGTEQRFIPHPVTWLNQDRFLEEFADDQATD